MRSFTSFYSVQDDNKLDWYGRLEGMVLQRSCKTIPSKRESIQEAVIPTRSEESYIICRTVLIFISPKKTFQFLQHFRNQRCQTVRKTNFKNNKLWNI
jgi:hypothetical protein